jgi:hypothetical protein
LKVGSQASDLHLFDYLGKRIALLHLAWRFGLKRQFDFCLDSSLLLLDLLALRFRLVFAPPDFQRQQKDLELSCLILCLKAQFLHYELCQNMAAGFRPLHMTLHNQRMIRKDQPKEWLCSCWLQQQLSPLNVC